MKFIPGVAVLADRQPLVGETIFMCGHHGEDGEPYHWQYYDPPLHVQASDGRKLVGAWYVRCNRCPPPQNNPPTIRESGRYTRDDPVIVLAADEN